MAYKSMFTGREIDKILKKVGEEAFSNCPSFADESGFMPAEISTDGIHLIQEEYARWGEYLRTHYADSENLD